jgi:phosphatidylinositol 4-kinase B
MPSGEALLSIARQHKLPLPPPAPVPEATAVGPDAEADAADAAAAAAAVYGEPWESRKQRVRRASSHGRRPGWDLRCVIVKSGDDCRQELLAMQVIRAFHDIFSEAALPLWLRPYEVLVTSNRTAVIEMVPNAPSIHAIKAASPPGTSLRAHMGARHGEGTAELRRAQRCFAESMAAYSIICYLMQIKDRWEEFLNGGFLL